MDRQSETAAGLLTLASSKQPLEVKNQALDPLALQAEIAASLREKVWPLFESGKLRSVVHRVFPMAEAAEAHRLMESSAHIGKIMLQVAPSPAEHPGVGRPGEGRDPSFN